MTGKIKKGIKKHVKFYLPLGTCDYNKQHITWTIKFNWEHTLQYHHKMENKINI